MPGEVPGTGSAHRRAGTSDGCLEALAGPGPGAVAARGSAAGPRRVRRRAAGEAGACGSGCRRAAVPAAAVPALAALVGELKGDGNARAIFGLN